MHGIIVTALIASLTSAFVTGTHYIDKYEALIVEIREEAARDREDALKAAHKETSRRKEQVIHLEIQNAEQAYTIDNISRQLNAERLRDPGKAETCSMPGNSNTAQPADSATGSELSEEFDRFLKQEALRADKAATYANLCYKWSQGYLQTQR